MPKSKSEMMRRLRKQRKDAGLVRVELWVDPEHREGMKTFGDVMSLAKSTGNIVRVYLNSTEVLGFIRDT